MMRSARDNAQLADTARQGVSILGPDTPAAARLETIARYLDYVSESITRAAEQARKILYTKRSDPRRRHRHANVRSRLALRRGQGGT